MLDDLFAYALTAVIVLGLAAFMRQRGWGIALPLIALGVVVGLAPFGPAAPPEPEVILILLLAPLVFGEALSSSYLDLRRVSRPVLALAIGLVLTATLAVGGVVSLFVAMPLAVAFALGAIVSPTDAVAVSTIAKRVALPRRLVSILEGESLVNDGTGLTALRVAVVAAVAGSVTMLDAAGMLAAAVGIGVLIGALAGWGMSTVLRRSAPVLRYVVAEEVEGSGILAVVVAALWLANTQHADPGWSGRLAGTTVWRHVTFILQTFAFCLIGLEIPEVFGRLGSDEVALVLVLVPVVLVTLVGTRFLFVGLMVVIERSRDRRRGVVRDQAVRQAVVIAWAGARGPVSGLAAFSLPLVIASGEPFPYRDVLLATTFAIIVISLLSTLSVAPLARALGVRGDDDAALARTVDSALARAALERLDAAVSEADTGGERISPEVVDRLRSNCEERLDRSALQADELAERPVNSVALLQLARAMVRAEQEELLRMRDEDGLPDAIVRPRYSGCEPRMAFPMPSSALGCVTSIFALRRLEQSANSRDRIVPGVARGSLAVRQRERKRFHKWTRT